MAGINATSSGQVIVSTVKSQIHTLIEAAKKTYQETGDVLKVSESYTSDDGNVKITLSGRTWANGEKTLDMDLVIDGQETATVQRYLSKGLDSTTGLPMPADIRFGAIGSTGSSEEVKSVSDIDAFEANYTKYLLETDDEADTHSGFQLPDEAGSRIVGRAEAQAYNRVQDAALAMADKISDKLDFGSEQQRTDFMVKLGKAIAKWMHHQTLDLDLSEVLKDIPVDQLDKAMKALSDDPELGRVIQRLTGGNQAIKNLVQKLSDYIDARKADEEAKAHPGKALNKPSLNLLV